MAGEQGNRTLPSTLAGGRCGFEDRGGHQAAILSRRGRAGGYDGRAMPPSALCPRECPTARRLRKGREHPLRPRPPAEREQLKAAVAGLEPGTYGARRPAAIPAAP